jgi:hypothetical protein
MGQGKDILEQPKYPVKYVKAIKEEGPHVMLFSDGKKYVVKWKSSIKGEKEVVNEYVVGKLAKLLSLPVIPFELVYITDEFIMKTPELHSNQNKYDPGYQYGCLYIDNYFVLADLEESPPSKAEIKNRDMLAGITVFDQWVFNSDRNVTNLLLEPLNEGGYYVHMIDHGRCFSGRYGWSAQTLSQKPDYKVYNHVYRWCFSLLDDHEELTFFVERIVSLPNELIYEVIQSIPEEWEVSNDDREALYNYLVEQKNHLPNVAAFFRKVVPLMDDMKI